MKSNREKIVSRAAMSEPHVRRRRATDLDDSIRTLKGAQSKTVQKRKSMSGRDLVRWRREQLKQRAEETISKRLFVDSREMAHLDDASGSPLLPDRSAIEDDRSRGSTPHPAKAMSRVQKGKKKKNNDTPKVATATPKMVTSTPEMSRDKSNAQSSISPQMTGNAMGGSSKTKNKKNKSNKSTPKSARKGESTPSQVSRSPTTAGSGKLDSSLDSTLPMNESTAKHDLSDDGAVTFPKTPVSAVKQRKKRTVGNLDTPTVTEKTPMPVGDEKWMDEGAPPAGQSKGDFKRSLSKVKRENKKKQYLVKCSNIPKGVTPELFAMFLGECEVYPEIRIKRMQRGGTGKKRPPRYAILVCKSKEDYNTLLNLDGIAIPQLTPKGKEMTLKFMPQLTHSEARSSHALRITNLADGVTEDGLREFFKKNRLICGKIQLYPADRAAYVVFKSSGDMRRARRMKNLKLNGSTMGFKTNKGYINHDVEHSLMED